MIAHELREEQMRARYPDEEGYVERDGVRVFYEVYGDAPTTFLLFPTSPISHSRLWKAQIPYLSRHFRVVCFDPDERFTAGIARLAAANAHLGSVVTAHPLRIGAEAIDHVRAGKASPESGLVFGVQP